MIVKQNKSNENQPREVAGGKSSSRFDYQKDWSLLTAITSITADSDQLFVFDYYEDFVIFNSAENPQAIDFFQIKGKEKGNWTIADLKRRKKGKGEKLLLSILGKMCSCSSVFCDSVQTISFVSNASFNVKLESGLDSKTLSKIELSSLDGNILNQLSKQIQDELEDDLVDLNEIPLLLIRTDLSLNDSSTHAMGVIASAIEKLFPKKSYKIGPIYKTLFADVRIKTNYTNLIDSYDEMRRRKGTSAKEYRDMIKSMILANEEVSDVWNMANEELMLEYKLTKRNRIKNAYKDLQIRLLGKSDAVLPHFMILVNERIEQICIQDEDSSLGEIISDVTEFLSTFHQQNLFSEDYVAAIVIHCFYEKQG